MRVFVAVGSNIEPERNIRQGLERLNDIVPIVDSSPFYETQPIGRPEQDNYWNGVVVVDVPADTDPVQFQFETLRGVEAAQGRVRTEDSYAARTLDLDVVLWGQRIVDEERLRLPDPEIARRDFLARCLLDIEPGLTLPGETMPLRAPEAANRLQPVPGPPPWPRRAA